MEKKLGTLIFFISHLRALGHVYPKHSSLQLSDRTSERTFSYHQILLMHVQKIDKCKILILLLYNSKKSVICVICKYGQDCNDFCEHLIGLDDFTKLKPFSLTTGIPKSLSCY